MFPIALVVSLFATAGVARGSSVGDDVVFESWRQCSDSLRRYQ
jgi:hypothetical protein